jgi:hypothetical protein
MLHYYRMFSFLYFDFEYAWWRLFRKRVVHIKFDI